MIDERTILFKELQKLEIKKFEANVITLDAGVLNVLLIKLILEV